MAILIDDDPSNLESLGTESACGTLYSRDACTSVIDGQCGHLVSTWPEMTGACQRPLTNKNVSSS